MGLVPADCFEEACRDLGNPLSAGQQQRGIGRLGGLLQVDRPFVRKLDRISQHRAAVMAEDQSVDPTGDGLRGGVCELAAQITFGVVHDLEPSQRHRASFASATYSNRISTEITPLDTKLMPLTRVPLANWARRDSEKL